MDREALCKIAYNMGVADVIKEAWNPLPMLQDLGTKGVNYLTENPIVRDALVGSGVGAVGGAIGAGEGNRLRGALTGGIGAGLAGAVGSGIYRNKNNISKYFKNLKKTNLTNLRSMGE